MHLILGVIAAVLGNGLQQWTNACDATRRVLPKLRPYKPATIEN